MSGVTFIDKINMLEYYSQPKILYVIITRREDIMLVFAESFDISGESQHLEKSDRQTSQEHKYNNQVRTSSRNRKYPAYMTKYDRF